MQIEDHLDLRVRLPADALRCAVQCAEIVLLVGFGLLARAADALYWLYRRVRLRTQVSRSGPLTVERAVERRALLTYAMEDAGVATPRLRAVIRVGPDATVLANEHQDGTTLADQDGEPTDEQLRLVWEAVLRLHRHRVTHRT